MRAGQILPLLLALLLIPSVSQAQKYVIHPGSNLKLTKSSTGNEPWLISWMKHWNLESGVTVVSDVRIESTKFDESVVLTDGFNDNYYFNWSINEYNDKPVQSHFTLRVPLYFNNRSSAGLFFYRRGFESELLTGSDYSSKPKNQNLGLFYSRSITEKLRVTLSVGSSNYELSATAGTLSAAWQGDPGYYVEADDEFIDVGTSLFVSGFSDSYTTFMIDLSYFVWRGVYVDLHYSTHGTGGTISEFDYELGDFSSLGGLTLNDPIEVHDSNVLSIGIGIGY